MVRIIAVINRKGGVGKTTTSLCLAEGLQNKGKSVLLIDFDQQHNSTKQYYEAQIEDVATVYDLITDPETSLNECIQHTSMGDIIAGDDWLLEAESKLARQTSREYVLSDKIAEASLTYDFIIIDCPPTLGVIVTNILVAADELIVPVLCDGYSAESFESLMQQVRAVQQNPRLNSNLKIAGLLITQYEGKHNISKEYDSMLPLLASNYGTKVYSTRIRRCVKTREAQEQSRSLFEYAGNCTTAQDYRSFIEEFLGGE